MKFEIVRDVDKNKFETKISFLEYGSLDMDETDEKELLDNYPQTINLKDIDFEGHYKVVDNEVVESDIENGDRVGLSVLQRELVIDSTFATKFETDVSKILSDEIGVELINETLVCQAKSLLFENKVLEAIEEKLTNVKSLNNDFEKQSPIVVTI